MRNSLRLPRAIGEGEGIIPTENKMNLKYQKQVVVVRKDLNMRRGKAMAQVAHASMKVILDRGLRDEHSIKIMLQDPALREWLNGTFTKVVVSVDSKSIVTGKQIGRAHV